MQTPILKIRQAIGRLMVGDDGAALVEFTILAPLLVVMSIYTMDFGLIFYNKMEVQNAAQAGVDWAIANRGFNSGYIWNGPGVPSAVANATNDTAISVPSPYPRYRCGCPLNTGVTFAATDYVSGTCPACSGSAGGLYVTVKTQAAYNSFIPYGLFSGANSTPTLTAEVTARIQ